MRVFRNGLCDVVAVEGHYYGRVRGGLGQRGGEERAVALIDRLAQRDAGEGDEIGIDRGLHEHLAAGTRGEQLAQDRRNLLLKWAAGFHVLDAFNEREGLFGSDLPVIPDRQENEKNSGGSCPCGFELTHCANDELRNEAEAKRKGRQQFHSIACVVPGVWPPEGDEDGHGAEGNGIGVKGRGNPKQQRPVESATACGEPCAKGAEHTEREH